MASGGDDFKSFPFWKKYFFFWTPAGAEGLQKWLQGWDIDPVAVTPLLFVLELWWVFVVDPDAVAGTLATVIALSPLWLPLFLLSFFWTTWIHYVRFVHWFNLKYVLLKIDLPAEVTKSPLAMELFLAGIYATGGESNFVDRLWKGKFRTILSLEIASNEGKIDFYLRVTDGWRNIVEAKLYGQYPEAKITQVEDYVDRVPFNNQEYGLWGHEFSKSEPQALPVKTYIDYGLDKNPDEPETQVDPITNLLEHMASIGPGEYLWMQIIFKARKRDKDEWYGFYTGDNFGKTAKEEINKILKEAAQRAQEKTADEKKELKLAPINLTPGEKNKIEAMERSLTKPIYECGFRTIYIGKGDTFNGGNIAHVVMFFAPFNQPGYNTLAPRRGMVLFTHPWQDWNGIRESKVKQNLFFHYKHRAYFHVPYDQTPVYMTTEELATIWHFPSSAVKTPALSRVPSRRAEAPPNLPV